MNSSPYFFRRQIVLGGFSAALLLATACSRSGKPKRQPLAKEATLLCLGDSLTYGYGAPADAAYPVQLEQLTGHVCQNAGVNGDTAEGALARLPALLEQGKPGLVLVSIGGNDFLRRLPLSRTQAALTQIVTAAGLTASVVLIAQPRPVLMASAARSLEDHPAYAEVASSTDTALFAEGWSHVLSRAALRSDQIHANAQGYRVFAERLAEWLREQKYVF